MTRIASIMGVAAVATLVLLSGCETPMKTDYAKKLEGTWSNGPNSVTIANPTPGGQPAQVPAMRTVTAKVERDGVNTGSFSVTVSDVVTGVPAPLVSNASGKMEVDATTITVTIPAGGITLPGGTALPEALMALMAAPQKLNYELTDDDKKLDLSSVALVALQVTASPTEKFTLTKQ